MQALPYAGTALGRHCLMQATIVKRQLTLFVIAHVLYGVHDNLRCLGNCLMQALPYAGTALCRRIHLNLMQALPLTGIMMHTQHTHFFDSMIQSSLSSLHPEPLQHPPLSSKTFAQVHRTASFYNCFNHPSDRSNERLVPV